MEQQHIYELQQQEQIAVPTTAQQHRLEGSMHAADRPAMDQLEQALQITAVLALPVVSKVLR